jgi:hypothetical protein
MSSPQRCVTIWVITVTLPTGEVLPKSSYPTAWYAGSQRARIQRNLPGASVGVTPLQVPDQSGCGAGC